MQDLVAKVERDFGRTDGLVNNARIMPMGQSIEVGGDTWCIVLDANLSGAFFCTQSAVPGILA